MLPGFLWLSSLYCWLAEPLGLTVIQLEPLVEQPALQNIQPGCGYARPEHDAKPEDNAHPLGRDD